MGETTDAYFLFPIFQGDELHTYFLLLHLFAIDTVHGLYFYN